MDNTLYFYSHTKGDLKCLSNFYKAEFTEGDLTFSCSEQYFMYQKAKLFKDGETAQRILNEKDPYKIKALGREVKNFKAKTWDKHREKCMFEANLYKFEQNEDLATILKSTQGSELVEAAKNDSIWGIGFSEDEAEANRDKWGQNLLGRILEAVRDILIAQDEGPLDFDEYLHLARW